MTKMLRLIEEVHHVEVYMNDSRMVKFFPKDLEDAPRPRQEIKEYIKAVTHMPCSCQACQLRKLILLWAFPGIDKEIEREDDKK